MTLAFIGFGNAAQALVEGLGPKRPAVLVTYDIKTCDAILRDAKSEDYRRWAIHGVDSLQEALAGASLVLSLIAADQSLAVARQAARFLDRDILYCEMNSVAPDTERAACAAIESVGGAYVDVAVMAPFHPLLNRTPLLVSGPHAVRAAKASGAAGLNPRRIEGTVGAASAIKMIRSIMIKGLEPLTAECLLSAHAGGVEEEVLASLDAGFLAFDWRSHGGYNLDRMLVHGRRRAAKIREAAENARALGQTGVMADATVAWQQRLGDLDLFPLPDSLDGKANAILQSTGRRHT